MAEYHWVPAGTYSPTKCVFCGDHQGPFIDTHLDLDVYGHVYVCASTEARPGCVQQMARLDNMIVVEEAQALVNDLAERCFALENELAEALKNRVVPIAEVAEWLNATRTTEEVAASGAQVAGD